MRFYIFKKHNDLSAHPDWYEPIIIKKIYSTTEFDLAKIRYESMELELKSDEVLFMAVDFGSAKEKKKFDVTYCNPEDNYFPYMIIKCTDDSYFNYEERFNMSKLSFVIVNDGIHQKYFNPINAFEKFEYYKNNRIAAIMAIDYIGNDQTNHLIPLVSIQDILWREKISYINRLGFEPLPNSFNIGPIVIKKKRVES